MFTSNIPKINEIIESLDRLSIDDQLAFLWYVYEGMGDSITPAAPGTAGEDIAEGLFNQVKEKSPEEQLQIQRDIASRKNTQMSRQYGSLGENTKLLFWYLLAEGMTAETIIPMPEDYQMSEDVQQLLTRAKALEYEEQITFLRQVVMNMGAEPKSGAEI